MQVAKGENGTSPSKAWKIMMEGKKKRRLFTMSQMLDDDGLLFSLVLRRETLKFIYKRKNSEVCHAPSGSGRLFLCDYYNSGRIHCFQILCST